MSPWAKQMLCCEQSVQRACANHQGWDGYRLIKTSPGTETLHIFIIRICNDDVSSKVYTIRIVFCYGTDTNLSWWDGLAALNDVTYFVRWRQLETVEDGKVDVVNNESNKNGRNIDQPVNCSIVEYFSWDAQQCNARKMAARKHNYYWHNQVCDIILRV